MEYLSTIIIGVLVGLCFIGAIVKVRRDRKKGSCGCSNECPHCSHCSSESKKH
ncbi:MAG: FeoB-associated Cys-rich membrane protein [Bacillota bacterium]|nr:FeoB-associated Cys-rich membrane protein [Bacillota bacterium]